MKTLLFLALLVSLSACTTTTTTAPDGTKITVTTSDPKTISAIAGVVSHATDTVATYEKTK